MRINYNISSIIARNCLNNNDNRLSNSIERLSSGLKINSAADDAAGLAISLKMSSQIRCLKQANNNANDGISVVNTADGAMTEMHEILQRMNELAIQAANGTNADSDREQIQLEIDQLVQELDRIAETTQFNAQNLLDGSFAYKGYTNTENVKVMSYSDGVTSGTYMIKGLEYYHDEDTIKDFDAYIKKDANGEVTHEDKYSAVSADKIRDALVTDVTTNSGLKAFPDGSRVILEDENIVIKGEDNFEVKLTLNNRKAVGNSGVTTTSTPKYYTTDSFRNVTVRDASGNVKYNISEISFKKQVDEKGKQITSTPTTISSSATQSNLLSGLSNDFADAFRDQFGDKTIKVTSCTYVNGKFKITAEPTDKSSQEVEKEFEVIIENPNGWDENKNGSYISTLPVTVHGNLLNNYLYTHTETTRTTYKVGDVNNDKDSILLDLTGIGAMRLQVGANEGQVIQIEIPALQALYMGVKDLDITTEDKATAAIDTIGDAINQLSGIRAKIGAYANRIEHTITNLDSTEENMTAAYSRIMDVDMATEMTEYSTVQVLVQSSTAMLAQANERPQSVLQLLQ